MSHSEIFRCPNTEALLGTRTVAFAFCLFDSLQYDLWSSDMWLHKSHRHCLTYVCYFCYCLLGSSENVEIPGIGNYARFLIPCTIRGIIACTQRTSSKSLVTIFAFFIMDFVNRRRTATCSSLQCALFFSTSLSFTTWRKHIYFCSANFAFCIVFYRRDSVTLSTCY